MTRRLNICLAVTFAVTFPCWGILAAGSCRSRVVVGALLLVLSQ
jgi:hypothetical protein